MSTMTKKQGSLFSFFAKKAPDMPVVKKTAAPSVLPVVKPNKPRDPPPGNVPPRQAKLLSKICVGTRVSVYWPDDKEYYAATITGREVGSETKYSLKCEYCCLLLRILRDTIYRNSPSFFPQE